MKVLIATQNLDKFKIISGMLKKCGLEDSTFFNLKDVNVLTQSEENGTLVNRAMLKATFAQKNIANPLEMDLFVGVDDGMKYKGNETNVDSKVVTENILSNNLLEIGEILTIVRAFAFVDNKGQIIDQFETEIPFKFIGNLKNIKSEETKYPLSHVLSTIRNKDAIIAMDENDSLDYYLEFSKDRILEALKKVIVN